LDEYMDECMDEVGAGALIVYGSVESDDRAEGGATHWISSVACLHNSAGTGFRSADLNLRLAR
jgi:hypothetical protein